jgi:hypothetical protein
VAAAYTKGAAIDANQKLNLLQQNYNCFIEIKAN